MNSLPDDWLTTHEIQALIERLRRSLFWSTSILQPSSVLLEHSPTPALLDIQSEKSSPTRARRLDTACGFAEYSRADKSWAVHHYALDSATDDNTTGLSKRRRRNAPCIATLKSTKVDEVSTPADIVQLLLRKEELSWMLNSAKMERQKGTRLCLICTTRQGVQIDLSSIVKQLTTGSRFVDLLAKVVMGNESWRMLNSVTNDWEIRRRCYNGDSSPSLYHLRLRRREPSKLQFSEEVEFDNVGMDRNTTHDNRRTAQTDHNDASVIEKFLSEQQTTGASPSKRTVIREISISTTVEAVPCSTDNISLRNEANADKSQVDYDPNAKHLLSSKKQVVPCDDLSSHQSTHSQSPQRGSRDKATLDLPLAVRRTRRAPCLTRKLALLESSRKRLRKSHPAEEVVLDEHNYSPEEQAPEQSREVSYDVSNSKEENLSKPQQSPRSTSRKRKVLIVDEQKDLLASKASNYDDDNVDRYNDKETLTRPPQSPGRTSKKRTQKVQPGKNVTVDEQESKSIQTSKYEDANADMSNDTKTLNQQQQSPKRIGRKRTRKGHADTNMTIPEQNDSLAGQASEQKYDVSNATEDLNKPQQSPRRSSRKRARQGHAEQENTLVGLASEHKDSDDMSNRTKSLTQTQYSPRRTRRSTRASLNKNSNSIQENPSYGSDSWDSKEANGDQELQASNKKRSKRHRMVRTVIRTSNKVRPRLKRVAKMAVISYRIPDEEVDNLKAFFLNKRSDGSAQSTLDKEGHESDESSVDLEGGSSPMENEEKDSIRKLPFSTMQLRPERLITEYRDLYNFYGSVLPAAFDPKDPFIFRRVKEKLNELGENGVEVEESEDVKADNQLYFRSVKSYKNKADSERIDKQREKEQLQLVLRELAYKERGKKKKSTAVEQEYEDFESRPFMYIHDKKEQDTCENISCVICRRDDEQKHPAAKLMPAFREIAVYAPDFVARDDDGSEEQSGSRNRRRRSKRDFRIREETAMKLTEVKHSIEFIEAYNNGLLEKVAN